MNNEVKRSFTWIPIYTELAQRLLSYKNNRHDLINLIYGNNMLKNYTSYLHQQNGQPLNDIDPLSFFGIFNRGNSFENRKVMLSEIKTVLNLSNDVPEDFDGIPVLDNRKSFYLRWDNEEVVSNSCSDLWDFFASLMTDDLKEQTFNSLLDQNGIGLAMITMPLFWCKPNDFLSLDSRNVKYLNSYGINIQINDFTSYKNLLNEVKNKMNAGNIKEKSFAEISFNAWKQNHATRYWLYAPGDNAMYWDEFYDLGIMAIGWDDIGDLSVFAKKTDIKNKMIEVYGSKDGSKAYMNYVQCTWDFVKGMNIGDVVFVKQGLYKVLGYGVVTSDYYFDENREEFCNVRKVDWKKKGVWEHPGQAVQKTLTDITQYIDYVEKLKLLFMDTNIKQFTNILKLKKNIILQGAPGTGKTYNTASLALSICGVTDVDLTDHDAVMKCYEQMRFDRDKNPFGQVGFCTFHQSMDYEDFVEGIKPIKPDEGDLYYKVENGIFKDISIVATNPQQVKQTKSLDAAFDDLIQNIIDGKIKTIKLKNGIESTELSVSPQMTIKWKTGNNRIDVNCVSKERLLKLCEVYDSKEKFESMKNIDTSIRSVIRGCNSSYYWAVANYLMDKIVEEKVDVDTKKNYVLIIDEINRGNVSKIFGELITLLEADKRLGGDHPIKVTLPYSKESFGVPSNLYIIGTMNTTDRSVGNIDYAVRRRFAFVTLESKKEVIEEHYKNDEILKNKALALFEAIESFLKKHKFEMDFADLMVGHSYFLAKNEEDLELKWRYEIVPLLHEYYKDGIIKQDVKTDTTIEDFCISK